MERRQQLKAQNVKKTAQDEIDSSQNQMREIIEKIERTKTPVIQPTETNLAMRQTHTSNYARSQRSRYEQEPPSSEEKEEDQVNEHREEFKHQRVPSAASQNRDIYEKVQQSEIKQQAWMSKIRELEAEKERIESETLQLQQQKN